MKHVVCYSGGLTSAKVAATVVKRFGTGNVTLLNHDINPWVEDADIKRFKDEVASALGLPVTYANIGGIEDAAKLPDQFDVCVQAKAFKVGLGTELCTNRLKTAPFEEYLTKHHKQGEVTCYYGFDAHEEDRVERRQRILGEQDYATGFPCANGSEDAVTDITAELGITAPRTYAQGWKHGNCAGCLKAGLQHWYKVYVERPDVYQKGIWAEGKIGYTIHRRDKNL